MSPIDKSTAPPLLPSQKTAPTKIEQLQFGNGTIGFNMADNLNVFTGKGDCVGGDCSTFIYYYLQGANPLPSRHPGYRSHHPGLSFLHLLIWLPGCSRTSTLFPSCSTSSTKSSRNMNSRQRPASTSRARFLSLHGLTDACNPTISSFCETTFPTIVTVLPWNSASIEPFTRGATHFGGER